MEGQKFYAVTCKCGHTGSRSTYCKVEFPIKALNGREAAEIARFIPRVKHHHKDCIIQVTEVSFEEYIKIKEKNDADPYLTCHSIQDQELECPNLQLFKEPETEERKRKEDIEDVTKKPVMLGKRMVKHPWRYMSLNPEIAGEAY